MCSQFGSGQCYTFYRCFCFDSLASAKTSAAFLYMCVPCSCNHCWVSCKRLVLNTLWPFWCLQIVKDNEVGALVDALDGKYTEPGPGGDPIRNPKVLPTGKNIHALDPQSIPTQAAVVSAQLVVERLLEREKENNGGEYPETVAVVLWGTDNIKTYGESLAQVRLWSAFGILVASLDTHACSTSRGICTCAASKYVSHNCFLGDGCAGKNATTGIEQCVCLCRVLMCSHQRAPDVIEMHIKSICHKSPNTYTRCCSRPCS